VVVDHPKAAAAALATPGISLTELAKASGTGDEIASLRITDKNLLKGEIAIIVQVASDVASEGRGFEELHGDRLR